MPERVLLMGAPLLKADEVAHRLCLVKTEVYELAKEGRLIAVRFGPRAVRFRPEDVEKFITDHLDYAGIANALNGNASSSEAAGR